MKLWDRRRILGLETLLMLSCGTASGSRSGMMFLSSLTWAPWAPLNLWLTKPGVFYEPSGSAFPHVA